MLHYALAVSIGFGVGALAQFGAEGGPPPAAQCTWSINDCIKDAQCSLMNSGMSCTYCWLNEDPVPGAWTELSGDGTCSCIVRYKEYRAGLNSTQCGQVGGYWSQSQGKCYQLTLPGQDQESCEEKDLEWSGGKCWISGCYWDWTW